MYCVTEFDRLNRTAVRKIFPVHPCAHEQPDDDHKHKHGWLLRGLERLENRDGQFFPLLLGQEFARKLHKLQIQSRLRRQIFFQRGPCNRNQWTQKQYVHNTFGACTAAVTSVRLATLLMPRGVPQRIMNILIRSVVVLLFTLGGGTVVLAAGDVETGKTLYAICAAARLEAL